MPSLHKFLRCQKPAFATNLAGASLGHMGSLNPSKITRLGQRLSGFALVKVLAQVPLTSHGAVCVLLGLRTSGPFYDPGYGATSQPRVTFQRGLQSLIRSVWHPEIWTQLPKKLAVPVRSIENIRFGHTKERASASLFTQRRVATAQIRLLL